MDREGNYGHSKLGVGTIAMEVRDFLTLGVAAYGAVLSTYNLVQGLRRERRQVRITQTFAYYTYADAGLGPPMVALEIVNHGQRPVVVNAPRMRMPDGRHLALLGAEGLDEFPKNLKDGESKSVRIYCQMVAESLKEGGYRGTVRLRPICTDSTGKTFYGKTWRFDLNRFGMES
jgi:hypothetical protein